MSVLDDGRPNLSVVNEAFGHHSDLYTDVLQVQPNAGPEQIHEAYFDRRNELFQLLADIDFAHEDAASSHGGGDHDSITDSHRRHAERRMDAVVCAVRILGEPDLRLQYDDLRGERIHVVGGGGSSSRNTHGPNHALKGASNPNRPRLAGRRRVGLLRSAAASATTATATGGPPSLLPSNTSGHVRDKRSVAIRPHATDNVPPAHESQSSQCSTASDASHVSVPDLMLSSISNATDSSMAAPPVTPSPPRTNQALSIRERLGVGATIRTRSGNFEMDDVVTESLPLNTGNSMTRSPPAQKDDIPKHFPATSPSATLSKQQVPAPTPPLIPSSRGRPPTAVANGVLLPKTKRRNSRTRSVDGDGSTTISVGSTTYVSDDDDDDDDYDEEYTLYTVDEGSVTESVLISSPKESKGILDRVRTEIIGALEDTTRSFEQVMNVFTLQDEDILAVMGRIDKAKRQISKTHILYPDKPEKGAVVSQTTISSGRKSSMKHPQRKALH